MSDSTNRELVLTRIIDAPPEKVFKAWTDPELLKQWFAPLPYTTPVAELDVRPGGASLIDPWQPKAQNWAIRIIKTVRTARQTQFRHSHF